MAIEPDSSRLDGKVEETEARYSNHLEIGQNAFEFVLAYGQLYEADVAMARIHTRIVTSPFYAKHFSKLLENSIRHYEEDHGPIQGGEP